MELDVLRVDRKVDRCWALWPRVREHIHAFGTRGRQKNIDAICLAVEQTFLGMKCQGSCTICAAGHDHFACWFVVERETQSVIAHLLAGQDIFNGGKVTFVLQAEGAGVPLATMRMVHFEAEQWAADTQGRTEPEILMLTHRMRLRAWARMFHYKPYRMLMRWEPPGDGE